VASNNGSILGHIPSLVDHHVLNRSFLEFRIHHEYEPHPGSSVSFRGERFPSDPGKWAIQIAPPGPPLDDNPVEVSIFGLQLVGVACVTWKEEKKVASLFAAGLSSFMRYFQPPLTDHSLIVSEAASRYHCRGLHSDRGLAQELKSPLWLASELH
jgi:hypothetical protein